MKKIDISKIKQACDDARDKKVYQVIPDELFKLDGPSGALLRVLKNNLCFACEDNLKYLEVGVEKGVGVVSSLYGIKPAYSVLIDPYDFVEPSPEKYIEGAQNEEVHMAHHKENYEIAQSLFKKYDIKIDEFLKRNCWCLNKEDFKDTFNFYFFDGPHDEKSQGWALEHFYDSLDDRFVFCVDDWNVEDIRKGTFNAIKNVDLNIVLEENFFTHKDTELAKNGGGCPRSWWNGYVVFVLEKK